MSNAGYSATYSPEDNKLRLYAGGRLPADVYQRVKAAGFRWAPRQQLFVAPMWTPPREDLLIELCGDIGDEDTSLVDRAEERAEAFENYSDKRAADANQAQRAVSQIADGIPLGQPILVGHHSERHARRDAKKIEDGMRRAVRMWETSQYWTQRAAGALRHAKYKERPDVRARRIKKIKAERRAMVRRFTPSDPNHVVNQEPWYCPVCREYSCQEHPEAKERVPHVYCGASRGGSWTPVASLPAIEKGSQRWLAHYDNRLAYERAMLGEQGRLDLLEKPKRRTLPPLLNYRAETLETFNQWHRGEKIMYRQVETTKARLAKVHPDYKGTRLSCDGSHRFRFARRRMLGLPPEDGAVDSVSGGMWDWAAVFLMDSKVHAKPGPRPDSTPPRPKAERDIDERLSFTTPASQQAPREGADLFEAMRDTLANGGVKVVSAPQLFETPVDLCRRMVDEADIQPGHRVLEPSAGTGRLVAAARERAPSEIVAVEINLAVADQLRARFRQGVAVQCCDFTNGTDWGAFDRIVMNPPFTKGQDRQHVRHAFGFLKPGGRLVAIMSPGPFFHGSKAAQDFRDWFDDLGGEVHELPSGTFKNAGTNVETRLVIIDKGQDD